MFSLPVTQLSPVSDGHEYSPFLDSALFAREGKETISPTVNSAFSIYWFLLIATSQVLFCTLLRLVIGDYPWLPIRITFLRKAEHRYYYW